MIEKKSKKPKTVQLGAEMPIRFVRRFQKHCKKTGRVQTRGCSTRSAICWMLEDQPAVEFAEDGLQVISPERGALEEIIERLLIAANLPGHLRHADLLPLHLALNLFA